MLATSQAGEFTEQELGRVRNFLPLRHLDDKAFTNVIVQASLHQLEPGQVLFHVDSDADSVFYLLDGEVEISDADNSTFATAAGSIETLYPLSPHAEARVSAKSLSDLRFIRLPAAALQTEQQQAPFEVSEINESDEALNNQVLFNIYHALLSNSVVIPSLPEVAVKIRQAAENPDNGAEEIAGIIQTDPSTSAYCINIANNAAFSGVSEIVDIREAVVRMGIESTRDTVTAYTIKSLFRSEDEQAKKLMHASWRHSCQIAATSFVLAKELGKVNPERAMLAGLLHEIGTTMLITTVFDLDKASRAVLDFPALIGELAGPLGAMVMRAWHFPESFVDAALEPENYTAPIGDRLSVHDIVVLAHYHDPEPPPWSQALPPPAELGAYAVVGEDAFDNNQRLVVINQASDELAAILNILDT